MQTHHQYVSLMGMSVVAYFICNENDIATENGVNKIGLNHSIINTTTHNRSTVDVEPKPLFFVDNTPSTDFTPPIYDIDTKANPNEIMSQALNFRISGPVSFKNKENQESAHEPIFTPDPMLSSTRLNDSNDADSHILVDHNVSTPMIHISIDSSCETGATRKIIVTASPKPSSLPEVTVNKITNANNNNNNSNSKNQNEPVTVPRASKRKADNNVGGGDSSSGGGVTVEPPQKKTASDVIVLDDTILDVDQDDDDDSVIFVCTEEKKPNEIPARRNRGKAANFIPINGTSNNQQSPRSTRAQRQSEKRRLKKEKRQNARAQRQQNAKVKAPPNPRKDLRSKLNGITPTNRNRFDTKNPSSSFDDRSSRATATVARSTTTDAESKREPKKKLVIKREMLEKLFKERPELFEKRMIIIDGSNIARSHGIRNGTYSVKGIELCIKYFEELGFTAKAIVPQMRTKHSQSTNPDGLERMHIAGKVVFTPCKNIPGNRSTCYDDRFILKTAELKDGAVISNDNFVDLLQQEEKWDEIIRERVVGFSWCDDFIMIPDDPYGKNGPSLQLILHKLKDDAKVDEKYLETNTTTATTINTIPATTATTVTVATEDEPSVIICDE